MVVLPLTKRAGAHREPAGLEQGCPEHLLAGRRSRQSHECTSRKTPWMVILQVIGK